MRSSLGAVRAWFTRLWNTLRPSRADRDLEDELRLHLDLEVERLQRTGYTPEAARRAAVGRVGALGSSVEAVRDRRGLPLLADVARDVRVGWRGLRRTPGFALVVVLTLSMGLGAAAAIFTVVYDVLLQPLPYPDAARIVQVSERTAAGTRVMVSDPNFDDLHAQNQSLSAFARYQNGGGQPVVVGGDAVLGSVATVSQQFFDVVGIHPARGRAFLPAESHFGAAPVAVVSDGFWREHFGGRADLAGATLRSGDVLCTVVGVMPPGFAFPSGTDIWLSTEQWTEQPTGRTGRNSYALGRLAPGVSLERAREDLSSIAQRLAVQYGSDTSMRDADVVRLQDYLVGDVRPALWMLLGAALFLLLIVGANVLNLLLARAAARGREVALRLALGAGRWRIVRHVGVETLLLALAAGVLAVAVAVWSTNLLRVTAPRMLPRAGELVVAWPVIVAVLVAAMVVGLIVGSLAAWRATAAAGVTALRQEPGATRSVLSHRLRNVLVVGQLAASVALLVGTGLLTRSLMRLTGTDPGFRGSGIAAMRLYQPPIEQHGFFPPEAADGAKIRRVRQIDEIAARLRSIPGVDAVGVVDALPLTGNTSDGGFLVFAGESDVQAFASAVARRDLPFLMRAWNDPNRPGGYAGYRAASDGYFRAMGIPLVRGRFFDERDTLTTPHVALVSESLARSRWAGQDPIGQRIEFGNMDGDLRPLTIVGIVGDVRDAGLDTPPRAVIYTSYRQRPARSFSIVMHTTGTIASLAAPARAIVHAVDPTLPTQFSTMEAVMGQWLAWRRFMLTICLAFAATAFLVALLGLYGALSYAVAQERREIGIRLALGATPGAVRAMVVRRALGLTAVGLVAGGAISLVASRTLTAWLYEVRPGDPATYVVVAALVALAAVVAAWWPARRATQVDAMVVMRAE
ncbi:MAG TPA: ADOP family duplicated permease [Vicinamibacterales bacterium]|nr:ADOP family duplicated permease [Vicinamibacterales bacterium]